MESRILQKAISGDPEALTLLIDKYKNIAYNLALSIVKNKEDAKDITQDSLLKVLENIHKFRKASKFSTWLYRIVYNQSVGFIANKKQKYIQDYLQLVEPSYHLNFENRESKFPDMYKAINALDDNDRNIIMLFYLAEKSIKEIVQITGLSISNIKVILHRARKKLYKNLNYENE